MDYEQQRRLNIANAQALLAALDVVAVQPKSRKKRKPDQSKKRGAPRDDSVPEGDEDVEERPRKTAKVQLENGEVTGLRRSARNKDKETNYREDGRNAATVARALPRVVSASVQRQGMQGSPRDTNKRRFDPKAYGPIPGVCVGSWWETRQACSNDAIHAPWVAGISSGPKGAYSVALSGGYEDDIDLGEAFTFTGSGGRDLKGTKDKPKNLRTAPQSSNQTFENSFNAALLRSSETKMPVRVIRGYKLDSPYAPAEGYRYDGLYTVEKAWQERGLNPKGYLVCKFALKRLPDQPPLQTGDDEEDEESASASDEVKSENESSENEEVDVPSA